MTKNKIKPGLKIHRWLVLEQLEESEHNRKKWLCICECGVKKFVDQNNLKSNNSKSCGCLQKEIISKKRLTHGSRTKEKRNKKPSEYETWLGIKKRCYNTNHKDYHYYGGRGIKVSEIWLNSFEQFYADMGERPSSKHSIERNDVNGNYCKENCRWATSEEQHNNKRNNRFIEYNGRTQTLSQWSKELNTDRKNITYRLDKGVSVEETFSIFLAKLNKLD